MFFHLFHELLQFPSLLVVFVGAETLNWQQVVAGIQKMVDFIIFSRATLRIPLIYRMNKNVSASVLFQSLMETASHSIYRVAQYLIRVMMIEQSSEIFYCSK